MQGLIKTILCIISAIVLFEGKAQSYHFSQFYSTPLLNNPASTGNIEGPFRAAANFRSQWAQGSSPYLTSSLSLDTKIFRNSISENNRAGAGIYFMNDQSAG